MGLGGMKREPVWLVPDPWESDQDEADAEARRQRRADYHRVWRNRAENRARRREYNRRWMARKRAAQPVEGWLHELACDGNHRGTVACQPVPCYRVQP